MSRSRNSVSKYTSKASTSKYSEATSDGDSDTSDDEEFDIHEIVRTGTLSEVKEAIARDRPRLIALKDKVSTNHPLSSDVA